MRKSNYAFCLLIVLTACQSKDEGSRSFVDPLPSWNDGANKAAILNYVNSITKEGTSEFIPIEDRIATFDNDGTLWAEKPIIQSQFAFARAKQMMTKDPSLKKKQPFKAIAEGDLEYLKAMDATALVKLVIATHTGMTEDEFDNEANLFFETARHPTRNVPMQQLVYQPQVELLRYLSDNGFKTFICSGGSVEFVRAISERYYGIPPERVIGTRFKYLYDDSLNVIYRETEITSFDDKQEKPVSIQYHVGKRPIFACGNEGAGGDIYMLRFSQGSKYSSFQLIINHDDWQREFLYQENDSSSLRWAKQYRWHVVSMKDDWKEVFVK